MPKANQPPAWRAVFLRVLSANGNALFAAAKAGVNPATAYVHRKRDAGFAQGWAAAVARGRGRVAAGMVAARPAWSPPPVDPDLLVARRTAGGAVALVRAGPGRWTIRAERVFLDCLVATASVTLAARAAGFSLPAVYARRKRNAAFAERWTAALREGEARIPDLLTAAVLAGLDPAGAEDHASAAPAASVAEAIAIARLKGLGRSAPREPDPSTGVATRESTNRLLMAQIAAARRRQERDAAEREVSDDDTGRADVGEP